MSQNQSLSTQEVADILHVSKSTIYDLIRRGEIHSYKIGRKVRFTQDDVDAYIARSRHEHSTRPVQRIDTHSTLLTPEENGSPELIIAGQDVVLDILANYLQQESVRAARTYLSSFEGLLALYQDHIQVAACHLFDGEDYNGSYVRSLMPGISAALVNVSYRTQGFYVRKGNPKNIRGWQDLRRGGYFHSEPPGGLQRPDSIGCAAEKAGDSGRRHPGLWQNHELPSDRGCRHRRGGRGSCGGDGTDIPAD